MARGILIFLILTVCGEVASQQTVFYNWLKYRQQKKQPFYESNKYWAEIGILETHSSYILPYSTTDFTDGEGGFFVLHKDGRLDSVLLWDIYRPHVTKNDLRDIIKVNANLYIIGRTLTDTSEAQPNHIEIIFVDSFFKPSKKLVFKNKGLQVFAGFNLDFENKGILTSINKYVYDTTGTAIYAVCTLFRIDTLGHIDTLFVNKGLGSNYIRAVALDTFDNTYLISSTTDSIPSPPNDRKDTFFMLKMSRSGTILWKKEWSVSKDTYEFSVFKPNIAVDKDRYCFFQTLNSSNRFNIKFNEISRDGKNFRIIQKYDSSKYDLFDKHEYLVRLKEKSYLAFGYSQGLLKEWVFDTQQNRLVANYSFQISKIDSNGNVLWTRRHNTNNDDIVYMRDWRILCSIQRASDGGYLLYGYSNGLFNTLPFNQAPGYCIIVKTDSCGFSIRDTCKVVPIIDSIKYRKVYIRLEDTLHKVCGRKWYVDGKVFDTERLEYEFSDTGTFKIKVWGFAGATVDSTTFDIHITQLDSCASRASDTCMVAGKQQRLACYQFLLSIDSTISQYCTQYWAIEGKKYTSRTLAYTFTDTGIHTVYAVAQRGIQQCIDTLILVDTCRSGVISLYVQEDIQLYPNPVEEGFWLKSSTIYPNTKTTIYNALGAQVASYPMFMLSSSPVFFSTQRLAQGVYYVEVSTDKNVVRRKIIKM